jgi:hypothetical protein
LTWLVKRIATPRFQWLPSGVKWVVENCPEAPARAGTGLTPHHTGFLFISGKDTDLLAKNYAILLHNHTNLP